MIPQGVGTFSTIGQPILRTFIFRPFFYYFWSLGSGVSFRIVILRGVFDISTSQSMCFAIVVSEFLTTAPSINFDILILPRVFEGQFSNNMCFAIVMFEFFTTAPSINCHFLILPCVFELSLIHI